MDFVKVDDMCITSVYGNFCIIEINWFYNSNRKEYIFVQRQTHAFNSPNMKIYIVFEYESIVGQPNLIKYIISELASERHQSVIYTYRVKDNVKHELRIQETNKNRNIDDVLTSSYNKVHIVYVLDVLHQYTQFVEKFRRIQVQIQQ